MEKIDYGDLNKFLVSIGVVLIGLSIITPYLYLKEDFGLYIELDNFNKFQEPIKTLITSKQSQISEIQKLIPWISIGLFASGLAFFIIGLIRWKRRQEKLDEKFDKELLKLELEIKGLTPEEQVEKVKQEVQKIENIEKLQIAESGVSQLPHHDYVQQYMTIEKNVSDVLIKFNSPNFDVLPQQKIGNRYEIDILMKARTNKYLDRIIEIKYFKNRLPIKILSDTINKIHTQVAYYSQVTNRRVIPVLLIVYNKKTSDADIILKFQNRLIDESQDIPLLQRLKVEFIEETEIQKFDVRRIIKR